MNLDLTYYIEPLNSTVLPTKLPDCSSGFKQSKLFACDANMSENRTYGYSAVPYTDRLLVLYWSCALRVE